VEQTGVQESTTNRTPTKPRPAPEILSLSPFALHRTKHADHTKRYKAEQESLTELGSKHDPTNPVRQIKQQKGSQRTATRPTLWKRLQSLHLSSNCSGGGSRGEHKYRRQTFPRNLANSNRSTDTAEVEQGKAIDKVDNHKQGTNPREPQTDHQGRRCKEVEILRIRQSITLITKPNLDWKQFKQEQTRQFSNSISQQQRTWHNQTTRPSKDQCETANCPVLYLCLHFLAITCWHRLLDVSHTDFDLRQNRLSH
jgi:hypothetical protein